MSYPIKRNLDGVYYRIKRDGKWDNICFSDLTSEEREKCMRDYTLAEMKSLVDRLANALHQVGDSLNIVASFGENSIIGENAADNENKTNMQ